MCPERIISWRCGIVLLAVLAATAVGGSATAAIVDLCVDTDGRSPTIGECESPTISADGRYVGFVSDAPGMVPGDLGGIKAVFVKDLLSGAVERVGAGTEPRLSGDGRYVAFTTGPATPTVVVYDRVEQITTTILTQGAPQLDDMSPDRRFFAFRATDPALVSGHLIPLASTQSRALYVLDSQTSTLDAVGRVYYRSVSRLTPDGRYVLFADEAEADSRASILYDRVSQTRERIDVNSAGASGSAAQDWVAASADARYVIFRAPEKWDGLKGRWVKVLGCGAKYYENERWAYVRDRQTQTTECWRVRGSMENEEFRYFSADVDYRVAASADARYFATGALVADRQRGTTRGLWQLGISQFGNSHPWLSADGDTLVLQQGSPNGIVVVSDVHTLTACGDGQIQAPEECEDGNYLDHDACTGACKLNVCGDGIVYAGVEHCDDGNTASGDGCDASCKAERVAGGGSPKSDCFHQWVIDPTPTLNAKGVLPNKLTCKDDDPACDFGVVTADQMCTFRIASCVNIRDDWRAFTASMAPMCVPVDLDTFELKVPKASRPKGAIDLANRDAIEAAFAEGFGADVSGLCKAPVDSKGAACFENADCDVGGGDGVCAGRYLSVVIGADDQTTCTDYMPIQVPRNDSRKLKLIARGHLIIEGDEADTIKKLSDSDSLSLTCLP